MRRPSRQNKWEKGTMQADKKIMLLLIPLLLMLLLSGCQLPQQPVEVILPPATDSNKVQQSDSVARRFKESTPQGPTAVESAIELSQKYAELSKESAELWQKNQDLITKNRRLEDSVVSLETKLQQTQRELTEANDLLIEMRIELNNWKTDILGFRGEMREAEKAQLEALLKILKILGGEVKTESAQGENTDSSVISPNESVKSQLKKTLILAGPNE